MKERLLETDVQTMEDLRIFSKDEVLGIFDIYNRTHTRGGEQALRDMFLHPLSDGEAIRKRANIFAYFTAQDVSFPFDSTLFDMAEKYIHNRPDEGRSTGQVLAEKDIQNGVSAIIQLMQSVRDFINTDAIRNTPVYQAERGEIQALLDERALEPVFKDLPRGDKISYAAVTAFDLLFRTRQYTEIQRLLSHIYRLDAYLSVAHTAAERHFAYPQVHDTGSQVLRLKGLYHPELEHPIPNDIEMEGAVDLIFLTGANMAGKSTFLRSISTAVYLAHMGFPVAAKEMAFSVMDGLYTTINLPDNLGIGASHFYAEVLRVKKIATELNRNKDLFVVFDELFRGTNVKDAHEATVAVSQAFARRKTCRFIISSHIVEAAAALQKESSVDFLYLPTKMNGHTPEYTYTLGRGVTDDRHGMIIIRNEGILDILKHGKKSAIPVEVDA